MLKFRINAATVAWVKDHVAAGITCWVCGDANVYTDKKSHDGSTISGETLAESHAKFSNPGIEEAKYVVHFKKGDVVPDTPEKMIAFMQKSKQQEQLSEQPIYEVETRLKRSEPAKPAEPVAPVEPEKKVEPEKPAEPDIAPLKKK